MAKIKKKILTAPNAEYSYIADGNVKLYNTINLFNLI